MRRHLHWYHAAIVAVLALLVISFYHQANAPVPPGYALAQALGRTDFADYLRPALPIVDHYADPEAADPPKGFHFTKTLSNGHDTQTDLLLENREAMTAIEQALEGMGLYEDEAVQAVDDARGRLQNLAGENLLLRLITADTAILEKTDDLPAGIETALLLTALHPTGAVACIKSPGQTIYLLTLADDNAPGATDTLFALYAFGPDASELWTGTLEVPRAWTPEETFAVVDSMVNPAE